LAVKNYDLEERLINFAVMIIDVIGAINRTNTGSHMAVLPEALKECNELTAIFVKSIRTAEKNLK
jgi:hypothetical protein